MRTHDYIILHHTGAEEKDTAQVKRYHLSQGFRDIGYNMVIERDGRIVPGRPLALPGAHCVPNQMNYKSIGVALIGNFEHRAPTPAQLQSLLLLLGYLQLTYKIPAQRVLPHQGVRGSSTRCPGKQFPWENIKKQLYKHIEIIHRI